MTSEGQEWKKLSIERKIGTQIESWGQNITSDKLERKPFITISREYGAEGWVLGQRLEELINESGSYKPPWVAYNKEILEKLEKNQNLTKDLVESLEKPAQNAISEFFDNHFSDKPARITIFKKTARTIKTLASHGNVILVGRGGCFITQDMKKGFHIRCVAPFDWRVHQIEKQYGISLSEAEERVKSNESERGAFIKDYFFTDQSNPHYYDMVINSSRMALDDSAELIIYAMKKRGLL